MSKKPFKILCVGAGAALAATALWCTGILDTWECATWNKRVQFFARPSPASEKIKIILLDQASLDWGKNQNGWSWPWPREVYAPILDFCRRGGAKAVAFDVIYTEPSSYGVSDDSAFGAAIGRAPPFVGAVNLSPSSGQYDCWPPACSSRGYTRGYSLAGLPYVKQGETNLKLYGSFPVPEIASRVTGFGEVDDQPDADGIFRRAKIFSVFDNRALPSLGLAAGLAAAKKAGDTSGLRLVRQGLAALGAEIPLDKQRRLILRYAGKSGTHETFSAAAIIQSELRLQAGEKPTIDPLRLNGRYVFFGFSAPGLLDLRPTPVNKVNPGVEIHAAVLDNVLSREFMRDTPRPLVFILTLFLALLSSALVIGARKVRYTVLAFAVLLPLTVAAAFATYAVGYWLPFMVMVLSVLGALVAATIVNYATEGRQKAFIKHAFKQYLGAEVIEQLIADPSRLQLGGEKRELAIFFSDIEKFSSFSEKLDPPTLTALLNDFLTDMTGIILDEGGYLDKYIGDAIVAFWNAPLAQPDYAVRACRAAIRCQRRLAERRQEFFDRTGATIKMRVGINTGDVVVGNMGSKERFNYTVLGDAANLASRLEGANKAFGTYCMVSGSTWSLAREEFSGREIAKLRVVGRIEPVQVFECTGFAGEPVPAFFAPFGKGLELFYQGRFDEALRVFSAIHDDPVAVSYVDRCKNAAGRPMPDWDGVVNLTEK